MKWNNEKLWCWLIMTLILFGFCSVFIGCSTKERVLTKQTYISDYQLHWDSIFNARISATFEQFQRSQKEQRETSKVETNHIRDSTSTMVDKDGNVLRKDSYHYESHNYTEKDVQKLKDSVSYYKTYKDSIEGYRLKIDSLQSARSDSIPYPVYIEKQFTKKEKMYLQLGEITFYFLIAFIMILVILTINRYRKRLF